MPHFIFYPESSGRSELCMAYMDIPIVIHGHRHPWYVVLISATSVLRTTIVNISMIRCYFLFNYNFCPISLINAGIYIQRVLEVQRKVSPLYVMEVTMGFEMLIQLHFTNLVPTEHEEKLLSIRRTYQSGNNIFLFVKSVLTACTALLRRVVTKAISTYLIPYMCCNREIGKYKHFMFQHRVITLGQRETLIPSTGRICYSGAVVDEAAAGRDTQHDHVMILLAYDFAEVEVIILQQYVIQRGVLKLAELPSMSCA